MTSFDHRRRLWIDRLGSLRNTVRQEVIRRQLARHVGPDLTVLDIGCGQGTQAVEMARRGCRVTGLEPAAELRDLCRQRAAEAEVEVEVVDGTMATAATDLGHRRFDVVCAHGLFMYLEDPATAIAAMKTCLADGGLLSFTVRNGDGLAMRPGLRRQWSTALAALDAVHYTNDLGADARADRLDDIVTELDAQDLAVEAWYGVRVMTDWVAADVPVPDDNEELDSLLDLEEQAGARDPYRRLGAQFHFLARSADPSR